MFKRSPSVILNKNTHNADPTFAAVADKLDNGISTTQTQRSNELGSLGNGHGHHNGTENGHSNGNEKKSRRISRSTSMSLFGKKNHDKEKSGSIKREGENEVGMKQNGGIVMGDAGVGSHQGVNGSEVDTVNDKASSVIAPQVSKPQKK